MKRKDKNFKMYDLIAMTVTFSYREEGVYNENEKIR